MDNHLQAFAQLPEIEAFHVPSGELALRVPETNRSFLLRGSATIIPHGSISPLLEVELSVFETLINVQMMSNEVWIALQIPINNENTTTNAFQTLQLATTIPDVIFGRVGVDRIFVLSQIQTEHEAFRQVYHITTPCTMPNLLIPTSIADVRFMNNKFLGCSLIADSNRVYTYDTNLIQKSRISSYLPCIRGHGHDLIHTIDEPTVYVCERSSLNMSNEYIANLRNEITFLQRLTPLSPHFIPLLDYYHDNEFIYTIFPKYHIMAEDIVKPLDKGKTRALMKQIVHAVSTAHENNIVLRNICLKNILLIPTVIPPEGVHGPLPGVGVAYVISNVSSAQQLPPSPHSQFLPYFNQPHGVILGEGPYRPPEFWTIPTQNLGFYDPKKVDIWCLGIVMIILLTGKQPFSYASPIADVNFRVLCLNGINGLVKTLMGQAFEPVLMDLLGGMLAVNPADRMTIEQVRSHPWIVAR